MRYRRISKTSIRYCGFRGQQDNYIEVQSFSPYARNPDLGLRDSEIAHRQYVQPASLANGARFVWPAELADSQSLPHLTSRPTGKRIALPTRVEPKVFFANERTFLSWMNFTVILGALAIGMLNFGDRPAFISAFLFTGVAVATMVYALITYHWRAKSIRMRGQAGFDDRYGPTFLAVILLVAVVVNFVLRITYTPPDSKP